MSTLRNPKRIAALRSASVLSTAATLTLAGALLATPGLASADYKTSSGSACQPYGLATTPADLRYVANGVTPRYDADVTILCNFVPDSEYIWYTAATEATAWLYFKAGSADAPVSCTVTTGSAYMYGQLTYSKAVTIPATLSSTLTFNDILAPGSYSSSPASVICLLPKRAVLARILLHEAGAT